MISRALILFLLTVSTLLADFNRVVLEETRAMPKGGGYATNLDAHGLSPRRSSSRMTFSYSA